MTEPQATVQLSCPDELTLNRFLNGQLAPDDEARVAQHVESCPTCQRLLDRLQGSLPSGLAKLLPPIPADHSDDSPPRLDGYEPLGRIDAGGMGVVWRVRDLQFQRTLAIKVMKARACDDPNAVRRFLAEAQITGQLAHPFIVPIHGMGRLPDNRPYYTMKLVEGKTLAELLRGQPDPASRRAGDGHVFTQICQAVAFAHSRGIIHRDLKPANIMVGAHGEVQVMDWGLAKVLDGTAAPQGEVVDANETADETRHETDDHTRTGSVLGTWAYMPPEQARGLVAEVDQRSDVFGLGAILCEVLTGEPPYTGPDDRAVRLEATEARLGGALNRLHNCGADPELIQLAERCLAPRKSDRPGDAREVSAAVVAYQAAVQERVRQAEREGAAALARLQAERRTRWWVIGLSGLVAGVLLAGLATTGHYYLQAHAETVRAQANEASAKRNAKQAAYRAYLSDLRYAPVAWEGGDLRQLGTLLDGTRPDQTEGEDFRGFEWYYWRRLLQNHCLLTYTGSSDWLPCLQFSPDGKLLADPVGGDGLLKDRPSAVRLSDARTGQVLRTLTDDLGLVYSLGFSPDGKRLAAGTFGKTVIVWDVQSGQRQLLLAGHGHPVACVCFSPDGKHLASATRDRMVPAPPGEIRIWDATTGELRFALVGHPEWITCLCFSPDGKHLASGGMDGAIKLWDAQTGQEAVTLPGPFGLYGIDFSPDGNHVASATQDGWIRLWDVRTGKLERDWKAHVAGAYGVRFRADGARLVTAGGDRTLRVWDLKTHQEVLVFRGHTAGVSRACFSPDGTRLASVAFDGVVKVWDAQAHQEALVLAGHAGWARIASFSADGTRLVSISDDGVVKLWDARTGRVLHSFQSGHEVTLGVRISPDGTSLATIGLEAVKVWDARPGVQAPRLTKAHPKGTYTLCFSPDGNRIVSSGDQDEIRIWDARTGQEVAAFPRDPVGVVYGVCLSLDGTRLAAGGDSQAIRVWDLHTGKLEFVLEGHTARVMSLCFSADGSRLASAGEDQQVKVWNMQTGAQELSREGYIPFLAISPDGKRLATTRGDGTVRLLDARTGQETLILRGHTDSIMGLGFSADGTRLVSSSMDRTVRIWDAPVGD